jgi:hypothetical protein
MQISPSIVRDLLEEGKEVDGKKKREEEEQKCGSVRGSRDGSDCRNRGERKKKQKQKDRWRKIRRKLRKEKEEEKKLEDRR